MKREKKESRSEAGKKFKETTQGWRSRKGPCFRGSEQGERFLKAALSAL